MIKYVNCSLLERLQKLYSPEDAQETHTDLLSMIEEYKLKISSTPWSMTEKDSILITYGDSIQKTGQKHLKTLVEFEESYLKDIINSIHILPFYPYSSDDGFSVIDYKAVNPDLGDWDDIEQLAENCRLMFDGVINHISQYSDWFKGYLEGQEKYNNFFIDTPPDTDISMVVRPRALPLLSPFEAADGKIHLIWTTFSRDQVDLNYANPKVFLAVMDVLFKYLEKGAKLIRLDAIAFVWKKFGTNCIHLEETHQIIQLMRDALHKIAPEVVIITETNVPHKENISYFGSGDDEAQMVYNFALPPLLAHGIITGNCSHLNKWHGELELPSDKVCFFNFTASHDGIGLRPVSGILNDDEIQELIQAAEFSGGRVSMRSNGDGTESPYELNCNYMDLLSPLLNSQKEKVGRMLLSQSIALAMPGVPGVYIHSLLGSKNDLDGVMQTGVNRSINREKLCWEKLQEEISNPEHQRYLIFESYRHMLKIRKECPCFNPFAPFEIFNISPSLFCMLRESIDKKQQILVLANFAHEEKIYKDLPYTGSYRDILTGDIYHTKFLTLLPHQFIWLEIQ